MQLPSRLQDERCFFYLWPPGERLRLGFQPAKPRGRSYRSFHRRKLRKCEDEAQPGFVSFSPPGRRAFAGRYSGTRVDVPESKSAEWLFHQEKAAPKTLVDGTVTLVPL